MGRLRTLKLLQVIVDITETLLNYPLEKISFIRTSPSGSWVRDYPKHDHNFAWYILVNVLRELPLNLCHKFTEMSRCARGHLNFPKVKLHMLMSFCETLHEISYWTFEYSSQILNYYTKITECFTCSLTQKLNPIQ